MTVSALAAFVVLLSILAPSALAGPGTPPGVNITSPSSLSSLHSPNVSVVWDITGTETGVTTECAVDSATPVACTSPWRAPEGDLTEGSHTITVTATDSDGDIGTGTVTFSVDPPIVNITTPDDSSGPHVFTSPNVSVAFNVTGSESVDLANDVTCQVDASFPVACTSPWQVPAFVLTEGTHTITVSATSGAAHTGTDTVTIDVNTPPVFAFADTSIFTYSSDFYVDFDVYDSTLDTSSIMCAMDTDPAVPCDTGVLTTNRFHAVGIAPGDHILHVSASDTAVNPGPQTSNAPDFPIHIQDPGGSSSSIEASVTPSTTRAGRHPDLLVDIQNHTNDDPESISLNMPDGFAGSLKSVTARCDFPPLTLLDPTVNHSNTDVNDWCDQSIRDQAKIGDVLVEGVVDGSTARMHGSVYLTERATDGEAAGIAIDVPAKVDNLDLGHVLVAARMTTRLKAQPVDISGDNVPDYDIDQSVNGIDTTIDEMPRTITSVHGTSDFTLRRARMWIHGTASGSEPVLTNASDCTPDNPQFFKSRIRSYDAAVYDAATAYLPTCADQPFGASMTMSVDSSSAGSNTGIHSTLTLDDGATTIKNAMIALPPSLVSNLGSITMCAKDDAITDPPSCNPDVTRIGSISIGTPLLITPIEGGVYLVDDGSAVPNLYVFIDDVYDKDGALSSTVLGIKARMRGIVHAPQGCGNVGCPFTITLNTDYSGNTLLDVPDVPVKSVTLDLPGAPSAIGPVGKIASLCQTNDTGGFRLESHTGRVAVGTVNMSFTGCPTSKVAVVPANPSDLSGGLGGEHMGGVTTLDQLQLSVTSNGPFSANFPQWKCAFDSADGPDGVTDLIPDFKLGSLPLTTNCTGSNEVQRLTRSGTVSGGTFKLTFNGQQTAAAIAFNATSAQVQAALEALSSVGAGNVVVTFTGGATFNTATDVDMLLQGSLASTLIPQATIQSSLTGGGTYAAGPLKFTYTTPASLRDGIHTLLVKSSTNSGASTNSWFTFVVDKSSDAAIPNSVDTTPPTTTITSSAAGTTANQSPTFDFDSGETGTDFACRLIRHVGTVTLPESFQPCGSDSQTGSFTPDTPLDVGDYTFEVRAEDSVGNVDSTPASEDFTVGIPFGPSFTVTGPGGDPNVQLDQLDLNARAHPQLEVHLRSESNFDLRDLKFSMPKGFVGSLLGAVSRCSVADAQAAYNGTGACPATSKVGTVTATAQSDMSDVVQTGDVFLTEPLVSGDPAGIVVSIAAKVGAIDMGTIVARDRLKIRGNAEGVDAESIDPVPNSVVDDKDTECAPASPPCFTGATVHFHLRAIDLHLTGGAGASQKLLTNPSDCSPSEFKASFTSYNDAPYSAPDIPYQATNCDALPFYTAFTANIEQLDANGNRTGAVPTAGNSTRFTGTIAASPDDSGVKFAKLVLPRSLTASTDGLPLGCSFEVYQATKTCDRGDSAVIGSAVATTPLLPDPLVGKVYLGKPDPNGVIDGPLYPETLRVIIQFRGLISVDLVGRTTLQDYKTVTLFENIPDAPVNSFTVSVDRLVRVRPSACDADLPYRTITGYNLAYNNKTSNYNSDVNIDCAGGSTVKASIGGKGKKARATVTAQATGGVKYRSLELTLPKGLKPIKKAFKKKVQVIADGRKLRKCAKLKGSKVIVNLCGKTARKVELRFNPGSLNMPKKLKKATFKVKSTFDNGKSMTQTIKLGGKNLKGTASGRP